MRRLSITIVWGRWPFHCPLTGKYWYVMSKTHGKIRPRILYLPPRRRRKGAICLAELNINYTEGLKLGLFADISLIPSWVVPLVCSIAGLPEVLAVSYFWKLGEVGRERATGLRGRKGCGSWVEWARTGGCWSCHKEEKDKGNWGEKEIENAAHGI